MGDPPSACVTYQYKKKMLLLVITFVQFPPDPSSFSLSLSECWMYLNGKILI